MHSATTHRETRPPTALLAALALLAATLVPAVVAPSAAATSDAKVTITSVKTSQVARSKTRTKVKVVVRAPKAGATARVRVSVNPKGKAAKTGKTITRTVKARWSKGAYRTTVTVRTGGPGKVTVRATTGGKTYKATRKAPSKLSTKVTGWDASRTVKAGIKITDTVKVAPAWGRKVLLQQYTGGKWVTRQSAVTAKKKAAKVKFTMRAPSATGAKTTKWRVRVPATNHAKAKKTTTRTLTRETTPTPTPDPEEPTPNPERPGWPLYCGVDGWGKPVTCYRPTISTVLDRWTYNPRCYHEQECWRGGGAYYDDFEWPARWGSSEVFAKGRVNWKPIVAPDWLEHLNTYRQAQSALDGKARHVLRPAPWSTTVDGYTVPGQGGHAQMWAMHVGQVHDGAMVHSNMLERLDWINERWPDARGLWWECGVENISGSATWGSSKGLFAWPSSTPHRNGLLKTESSYSSFGAALADNGTTITVYQGCYLGRGELDPTPAYEADGVTPAIWQPPAGWKPPTN